MKGASETPSPWTTALLGDLCAIRGGYPAPQSDAAFDNGVVPFVRMRDVGRHHFTNDLHITDQRLSLEHFKNGQYQLTPRGSILIPRSGSVGLNHRAILTVDAVIVSHLCALTIRSERVSPEYLYRYLCTLDMRSLTKKTTGLDSIAFSDLQKIPIPVPSTTEQRHIAAVLDTTDALRATRRGALTQLEALDRSIFLELFGDPITNPKEWPRQKVSQIGRVVTGNTPPRANESYYGNDVEWIKSDNINTPHYYLTKAEEGLSASGKKIARVAPANAILITCIAGTPECIGNAAMTDREVAFNQQINAIILKTADPHFIYAQIRVGKRLIQEASTSGMKGMVSKGRLEEIALIQPPLALQQEFARRIAAVETLRAAHRAHLAELDALFASLQHRAFRGEL